jgi:hypothetical protein
MSIAEKFNIPPALFETIRKMNAEETEYQMKVKALMKKKGITSLSQLSPEEKKDFFNTLDAMHKAKNEAVEELDELSKKTLSSYIDKADDSVRKLARTSLVGANPKQKESIRAKIDKRIDKRLDAMTNAVKKITNKNEEVELEDEMINEDLMKLDPITNTLVGLATAAGASLLFFDYWFGKDKDMRKPIEKGMAKAKKDGNSKLYHSLAAKYYEDQVTKSTKALNKLRSDPKSFYKKDSDKTGAKTGDMKKFEKRAEEELLRVIEIAKKKQKEFEAKEKSGEAITKKYYESVQHIEENVKTEPPFTPDKPKKNPGVIPGKGGTGPSRAAHLAKMALRKQLKKEEIELDESKSSTGYELYHKDFSSAMAHAYDFAKKKYNIEIDPLEIDRNVAMGPRKPASGKANAYRLLDKTGKKAIQVQVANLDNKRYELNMYKEDVQIDEVAASKALQKAHDDERKKRGLPDPSYYLKLAAQKKKEIEDMKKETQKEESGASKKKEDEFHTKLDKLVHKTFGHSSDEKKMKKEGVVTEMDKSQPSSSRGAEGLPIGKKADPVKTDKVKSDALKVLQKQYRKVKEEVELTESHFKVGQRVKCLKSGMSGTVTKD